LKNERLTDTILYVTKEPCAMCAGALVWARVAGVVYGVSDPKAGACGSVLSVHEQSTFNHRFWVVKGVLEKESHDLLKRFFNKRRNKSSLK